MTRKFDHGDIDNCINKYRAGLSVPQIARETGVSESVIFRALAASGIKTRASKIALPIEEIGRLYAAGSTEHALAKRFNVSRRTIGVRLREAGVQRRSAAEVTRLRWQNMTPEQRNSITEAAHLVARGRIKTLDEQTKRARTVMQRRLHIDPAEIELASMLCDRGIGTVNQHAIGPYNCDLGAYPVAVEIFGGEWHWHGRHLLRSSERFRYILNAGWHILVVKIERIRHPLTDTTADYIAAYVEQMRADPTRRREYRVIRGAGELLTAGSIDDHEITLIPALSSGRDILGRYSTVSR